MTDRKYFLVNTNGLFTSNEEQMTKQGVKYYTWHLYKRDKNEPHTLLMNLVIASFNVMIVGDHLWIVKVDVNENTTQIREQFANNPDNVREVSFKW